MALCSTITMGAQGAGKFVPFKYGNMDQWVTRSIKESGIIGGNQKTLYEVGPNMSLSGNNPYTNKGGSPWGTSMSWLMYPVSTRPTVLYIVIPMPVMAIVPNSSPISRR